MPPVRFAEGKIRLFEGVGGRKRDTPLIGIRFDKDVPQEDVRQIHSAIRKILELKYGVDIN